MNLIDRLVDAAYCTGYYSGKKEDGQPHHTTAILLREKLRHELLDLTRKQTPEVKALVDTVQLLEGVLLTQTGRDWSDWAKMLHERLAPFKVPE